MSNLPVGATNDVSIGDAQIGMQLGTNDAGANVDKSGEKQTGVEMAANGSIFGSRYVPRRMANSANCCFFK